MHVDYFKCFNNRFRAHSCSASSVLQFDDAAYTTNYSGFLFSGLMVVVVIVMMNILIAIVSDTYGDAMKRSVPLFWRARVDLIAEYEPIMPK